MNILLLLIPNLYDVFTLIMIGYAFMLHQKGELQISFAVACGLIYVATRLGIFAGKYIGIRGATFLVKWIPFLGNVVNAAVTFATTELLGWATYAFVSKGMQNPSEFI